VAIYSIGHSTRSLDELVSLLREHRIGVLADVRTAPGSRRLPQFGRASLAAELPAHGLAYVHLPELGGFRRPRPDSRNTAWRNQSFRGYADYMETPEFRAGLERLLSLQEGPNGPRPVAVMCAEAVPWRCHRSLISDALLARGVVVQHIVGGGRAQPHALTRFARVDGTDTSYPGPDTLQFDG
jgi:uncharacterized protein (DUF488 family)